MKGFLVWTDWDTANSPASVKALSWTVRDGCLIFLGSHGNLCAFGAGSWREVQEVEA